MAAPMGSQEVEGHRDRDARPSICGSDASLGAIVNSRDSPVQGAIGSSDEQRDQGDCGPGRIAGVAGP